VIYSVRHVTKFRYSEPVTESVMEVRMQPRTEGPQRCLSFELRTTPRTWPLSFTDDLQNRVHHFDVPDRHTQLTIRAEALVEIHPPDPLPDALDPGDWYLLDAMTATDEYWDLLQPSHFARSSDLLRTLARDLRVFRGADPLSTLRDLTTAVHDAFEYDTMSTRVDSPIDQALTSRHGVCQDFAHIMIALVRELGIPCRYVSGYLYHRQEDQDRSPPGATHAWVEALLPGLGWMGFDPTNDVLVRDRHIRVAIGRDYADVPPTRGVFKGRAETELAVAVRVVPAEAPSPEVIDEEDAEPVYRQALETPHLPDAELQEQPQQQ
jgi:transglutaminase-like putative cysteine protease